MAKGKKGVAFVGKDFSKNYYTGLKGIYFHGILKTIAGIARLDRRNVRILDFGCGCGELKKLLGEKVTGFDVLPELSDVKDWRAVDFDVVAANEVFYLFSEKELEKILREFKAKNPGTELVVGIARQNLLGGILAVLAGEPDAHSNTLLPPQKELEILQRHFRLKARKSVFWLCDVFYFGPRRESGG
ncbi:MAG: class I SAM-dependent methyltransferase [Candidatus Diapherotrites archaeon]|nr:class I SAM-dependent methyltransferase [Candidatus Diapherotrites archaeon]